MQDEVSRCLVVWPGDTFHTVSCGPTLSLLRWWEGRAGRRLAAGERMQMSSRCHSVLLWITAWSPHTLSFSFQDRKTGAKWPVPLAFWSEIRSLAMPWGAWLHLRLALKPLNLCHGVYRAEGSARFFYKFQLEATFGMKANGFVRRLTKTPVKAKWIPPLTKTAKFCLPLTPALPYKCPWMLSFFHPVNEKRHVWLFLI